VLALLLVVYFCPRLVFPLRFLPLWKEEKTNNNTREQTNQ